MKQPRGLYCKICGQRRANEKFSGSGYAAHICKDCARLPIEKRNELQILTRIENLPFRFNREQRSWLEKKRKDKREEVRRAAEWVYEMRFPERQRDCKQPDDEQEMLETTFEEPLETAERYVKKLQMRIAKAVN